MHPIDFFFRAAKRSPERIALESPSEQLSYQVLAQRVQALACALQAIDPEPQSRVAIGAGNTLEHVTALLAVLAAGKVWVPLNVRSTPSEIARITATIEPSIVITDGKGAELIGPGLFTWLRLDPGFESDHCIASLSLRYAGQVPSINAVDEEGIQAIKFTGGTTGVPKGVMQPYRAWMAGIINQINGWQITQEDCYVVTAPVTHGTSTYLLPLLAQGGKLLFLDKTDPSSVIQAFRELGGTMSFMPPTLIYMVMAYPGVSKADFPRLRNLIYGGAPMPAEKVDQIRAFFGEVLGTNYGQTEAPQVATIMPPSGFADPRNRGSVGLCTWLSDLAIMSPAGTILPENTIGEVVIRGHLVMKGYWRLPEKTAETLIDGWLHTGDVGLIDERGYLFLKDRIRDVIITGGFNIYPTDVENILSQHPAVYECAVFGMPDEKWGEAVHAAIQLRPEMTCEPAELIAFVKEALGSVHAPKVIHFFDKLPVSSVGKVLKTAIREQLTSR
ncbi:class I adenylate-forming enzyme family protein [Polynucleobacter brandtiae]|uniref:Acyl-CoA synthetase (AMP-forming)/AMP-acid ligase II n=1 Tax=Polynucleobacter brandtiae TaxID=1938816 RepID=A0A2M8VQV8_9BURK|nr:AMP-binding protein [Polynucleobacter brandtiae]PJI79841.1 acyl-CoA synthetase (AMP-forming)/AMP-acid ligase II [Polynucleobacter brandtiae]